MKLRSTSPQWCVCMHTNSVLGFDPNIKKKIMSKKDKTRKKFSVCGRLHGCLSKIPGTVCLRATALCAVHALAV